MTAKHIDVLLDYLERTLGNAIREEEQRNSLTTGPKSIFKNLWMLFKPGDVVYAKLEGRYSPFIVCRCSDGSAEMIQDGKSHPYKLDVWNLTVSSNRIRRCMYTFDILPFSGEDAIDNMPVIPARFFKDNAKVIRKHIELGKYTWELAKGPTYLSYNGPLPRNGGRNWSHAQTSSGQVSKFEIPTFSRYI